MNSKVSICIPTYNSSKFLRDMLESIAAQTYSNVEVIIADNASSDNTVDIAREYCEKYNWTICQNAVNIGAPANFNKLINMATGDYVAIYHADDIYDSKIVQESIYQFYKNKNIGLVSTLGYEINDRGDVTSEYNLPKSISDKEIFNFDDVFSAILMNEGLFLITSSVMVKREIYSFLGSFNISEKYSSACDYEMWFRILQKYDVKIINKNLIKYRIHSLQGSALEIRQNFKFPDSLNLYHDYMMLDVNKYARLFNYTYYRLMRVLAIKHNNSSNFDESNKILELIHIQTSSYNTRLFWLKICNYCNIRISLDVLIYIKRKIYHKLLQGKK